MKIAKCLFLLLLLTLVTGSVFITTADGSYIIKKSKIINVPKEKAYNYILDFKNWESFDFIKKDSPLTLKYSPITKGLKSQLNWTGNSASGQVKSIFVAANDSICQEMIYDGVNSQMHWKFKDTLKKTKVTWSTKGKMTFKEKCYSLLYGDTSIKMSSLFEKALVNIDKLLTTAAIVTTVTSEIDTFNISIEGFVERDTLRYLQTLSQSTIQDLPLKIKKIVPRLKQLALSTNTKTGGSPFIVYHYKDTLKNTVTYSIAIPVSKKVYTLPASDILPGQIQPFQAVKATLEGDYSHKDEMMQQIYDYMKKNKLEQNNKFRVIEILRKSIATDESPSRWVTDIYVPVKLKKVIIAAIKKDTVVLKLNTEVKDTSR